MIGLVADDLTGACDSAVAFVAGGRVTVAIWPNLPSPGDAACLAMSTETRSGVEPEEARARARLAAAHLSGEGATLIFKKVDSRLRGHVRAELEGVLDALGGTLVLAPALPAEGRITRGCRQVIGEEVIDLRPLAAGMTQVRIPDARTDRDLDRVAGEVLAGEDVIAAGTAGLAAALARRMGATAPGRRPARPPAWPAARNPLALVGSKTAAAAEQVQRALAAGWEVVQRVRGDAVELSGHDALFLSGGGTAAGVIETLGGTGIDLLGEALPRVPVGRLRGGPREGLLVCLKSGGFGPPDAIDRALRTLCHRD